MKNKFSQASITILLVIGLTVSQLLTFLRLNEQDKVIRELVRTNAVLFEICRLQTELTKLDILEKEVNKELKRESDKYREWKFNEI